MLSFYDFNIESKNIQAIMPDLIKVIIEKVQECKQYEKEHCSGSDRSHRLIDLGELTDIWKDEPYKTLCNMYELIEREAYKMPYSVLYPLEVCMMSGIDIYEMCKYGPGDPEDQNGLFYINKNDTVSLNDYEALAYYYSIPVSEEAGGDKQALIEYVFSKRDLDIYLTAYLKACGLL